MLELARQTSSGKPGDWQLGYGGDTLNTAIHLTREGHDVAYFTAIGTDPLSQELKSQWIAEGLDTSLVLEHPTRRTGLYAISTDRFGERSFTYWRETSAAREMFDLPWATSALEKIVSVDMLAFSLITLAILPPTARIKLLDLARRVRSRGGQVAFDGNYRARLWSSPDEAAQARDAAIACATIGLPTLEDEVALGAAANAAAIAAHWQELGCAETVVKLGAEGCLLPDGKLVPPQAVLAPVDTSGAGDAFNGGYLAARLRGDAPAEAARAGHDLAGWTIMRPGAIPAQD